MAFLECCLNNVSSDARVALGESDHDVRETFCLDRCGDCYDRSFLVVDGELRTGNSHMDLLESVDDQPKGYEE
ncbi:DUF1450 domain-containing protein [Saliphagus infecundisoli]|uniref:DUF1450 domain-containing protein n=1 Tax=Saliphagus infecundisoli TaxID=1849069 RepID=A0ABD5QAU1_9EURY|nr:DUF1450 domain-containing protein [Saliphagus infecundisoli]